MEHTNTIRSAFLPLWHEYVVYNALDIDGNSVAAQGQQSGKYYILTLDDEGHVLNADIYF